MAEMYIEMEMAATYRKYEFHEGENHTRRCIDGSITGSNKCVGYCLCELHPGFLTDRHRRTRGCRKKGCDYYVEKTRKACPPLIGWKQQLQEYAKMIS